MRTAATSNPATSSRRRSNGSARFVTPSARDRREGLSVFTMLLSGDLMVADPDATAQLLVERLGLIGHPNWRQAFPNHPYVAHFLRTHKSLAVAPTRIEPQGHTDRPNEGDP